MFHLKTRVIFAAGAMTSAREQLGQFGKNALLVTGRSSAVQSGAWEELTDTLKELGIRWHHFSEVVENPDLQCVITGAKALIEKGCDMVIGIGGGSPLDAAKAISIAAANQLSIDELYHTEKFTKAHPVIAIPTTSGTGSEVTQYSVLSDSRSGKKAGWGHELAFPALAIVDPCYTVSAPHHVTLNTGIDALSHLLEGLYSRLREPLIFPFIHKGIALIVQNLKTALEEPANLKARTALSQASVYGGMTIAQGSTTLQHSIGYPLTTQFGVPHGLANGIVMPQIMELYWPAVKGLIEPALASFGMDRAAFLSWLESLNLKADISIDEAFIQARVPEVMASRNMAYNPLEVTSAQVAEIYLALIERR